MPSQKSKKNMVARQVELRIHPDQWRKLDLSPEPIAQRVRQALYTLWDLEELESFNCRMNILLHQQPTGFAVRQLIIRDLQNYYSILFSILPTLELGIAEATYLCNALKDHQCHSFQPSPRSFLINLLRKSVSDDDLICLPLIKHIEQWTEPQIICSIDAVERYWVYHTISPNQPSEMVLRFTGLIT
jgi:hypothetical protein